MSLYAYFTRNYNSQVIGVLIGKCEHQKNAFAIVKDLDKGLPIICERSDKHTWGRLKLAPGVSTMDSNTGRRAMTKSNLRRELQTWVHHRSLFPEDGDVDTETVLMMGLQEVQKLQEYANAASTGSPAGRWNQGGQADEMDVGHDGGLELGDDRIQELGDVAPEAMEVDEGHSTARRHRGSGAMVPSPKLTGSNGVVVTGIVRGGSNVYGGASAAESMDIDGFITPRAQRALTRNQQQLLLEAATHSDDDDDDESPNGMITVKIPNVSDLFANSDNRKASAVLLLVRKLLKAYGPHLAVDGLYLLAAWYTGNAHLVSQMLAPNLIKYCQGVPPSISVTIANNTLLILGSTLGTQLAKGYLRDIIYTHEVSEQLLNTSVHQLQAGVTPSRVVELDPPDDENERQLRRPRPITMPPPQAIARRQHATKAQQTRAQGC